MTQERGECLSTVLILPCRGKALEIIECAAAKGSMLFSVYGCRRGATVAALVCWQVENGAAFY